MPEERYITIVSERKTIALRVSTILYVLMNGKYANIHVLGDQVYRTTMTLGEIEEKIGDGFLPGASRLPCGCHGNSQCHGYHQSQQWGIPGVYGP